MLLVPTVVKNSPIDGLGLYAAQKISKGTPVWSLSEIDWKITDDMLKQFPEKSC